MSIPINNKIEEQKLIKIAIFKKEIRTTKPHKHQGYFELIYLKNTTGYHCIDEQQYQLSTHNLFIIKKEQVHYWNITSEPFGYVILIKRDFFLQNIDSTLKQFFFDITQLTQIDLPEDTNIDFLFALLLTEDDQTAQGALLKALFIKIRNSTITEQLPLKSGIYSAYLHLLNIDHTPINKVNHYAKLLHTTPQNLNASCQKNIGLSAAAVLAQHIIAEAKRLLIYTDFSINEISLQLNFTDASHFTKYFKKHTTYTPNNFRKL
ncbi:hypothetical protein HMPREF9711_00169 [Myroides odoratimimus CCUG 3837]|uniref:AraC family transcriptional regulator n=1 Tax=Myroides odoratimimus TaxID=76832 RepID=UPI000280AA0A|nr:helix-turn-helix transcriptional regulator [Myroides odoratimimus]EKB06859.1 hypothetical protein HMPREF9711_00169 [Myroides odoratimimus CCUG 3837]